MDPNAGDEQLYDQLGYVLMSAGAAFQYRLRIALRPFDLNVTEYACLELLARRPGLSSADLARGSFASRQLMSNVLRSMADAGLVVRETAPGRARPTRLTEAGDQRRRQAGLAVREVEALMTTRFADDDVERLRADLVECVTALDPVSD